jgi:hypothetical protein
MATMTNYEWTFLQMDRCIWKAVGEAEQRDLELVALRLSPAALDVLRMVSAPLDWNETPKEQTWRGMKIIVEAGLPCYDVSSYEEIKLCVEAKQRSEHGRHFYFDADTSRLPRLAKLGR